MGTDIKEKKIEREHVLLWVIFGLVSFIIVVGFGIYYLSVQTNLANEVAGSVREVMPSKPAESSVVIEKDTDTDLVDLDRAMNQVSEKDFDETGISDSVLGL